MAKPEVITIGESMVVFNPVINTTFHDSHLFIKQIAGAESNYAIGLGRLGHQVGWISRLSNDSFGNYVNNTIRGNGVNTSLVEYDNQASTGLLIKEKMIGNRINVHYYRENSAASKMTPTILDEAYFSEAKFLFISGITPLLSDSCAATIFEAIKIAKKNNVKIIFDPNIRYKLIEDEDSYKDMMHQILKESDIFLPGINEAKYLCQKESLEDIVEYFLSAHENLKIVIKLGADGCYYADSREAYFVAGNKVDEVVDPIGAGDGFATGLTSGLLNGKSVYESLKMANLIGSIVIQASGDMEGLPFKHQLEDMVNASKNKDIDEVSR